MNLEHAMPGTPGNDWPWPFEYDIGYAARSSLCVLLTGRPERVEEVARRIHSISGWRRGEFLTVDCSRPGEALEEQLRALSIPDRLPVADVCPGLRPTQAGTIFLMEVGRLSPPIQARLAEHLMERCTRRLQHRWSWRLISSSSEPLVRRVEEGTFSDQLFYRLNMIHLTVPDHGRQQVQPIST